MGFLDNLMGNAAEVDLSKLEKELEDILIEGEKVDRGYNVFRDMFLFTDKRLLLVDKQGVTGKKVEYHSIPYKSITHFSVETAGTFDMDSELKIWLSGTSEPIYKQFKKGNSIADVHKALATYTL
ncbi:PH domain-containing protein [Salimicrobium halophilum]|uniref:PH domain-containing protein n=1 Tax=Salimicrobium halophilum TaxID=86666 RepID=A0A1G8RKW8_9BACI|nr:PH domain-containing protein [Salimicrobium halophilum]SDJ17553.1 PH domain-containing protein [Salimicrobium halophilum]